MKKCNVKVNDKKGCFDEKKQIDKLMSEPVIDGTKDAPEDSRRDDNGLEELDR